MKKRIIVSALFILLSLSFVFSQTPDVAGLYRSPIGGRTNITLNADSTFRYATTEQHPTFYRWENFSETGRWSYSAGTVTLNPTLARKPYVESDFRELKEVSDANILLTFNHVKRYFNSNGDLVRADTVQISRLDYSFNKLKKTAMTRVAPEKSSRCTFAGYIPKEIITSSRSVSVAKPAEQIQKIYVGCYELQGTKEFIVKDPAANHFVLTVYSNYYEDGQIRQMKFIVRDSKPLFAKQHHQFLKQADGRSPLELEKN